MQFDISVAINKRVLDQQCKMRREKQLNIPTTEDIKKFSMYLDREREQCFNELSENYSFDKWSHLMDLTVTSIIVFNRRRTGEVQNIQLKDFHKPSTRTRNLSNLCPITRKISRESTYECKSGAS